MPPIPVNVGGGGFQFRGRPRFGGDALSSILRAQPQRPNDDLIALLFQILIQQQGTRERREENELDRQLRRNQLEEQERSARVGERQESRQINLLEQQLEEALASGTQQRDALAQALAREQTARVTERGSRTFARGLERERERLELSAEEAGTAFAKGLGRGQRVVDASLTRLAVALQAVQDSDDPPIKQIETLDKAIEEAVNVIQSAITAGGALSEDGLSKAETLGALQELTGVVRVIGTLDVGKADAAKRRLAPLVKRSAQLSQSLTGVVENLGGPPVDLEGGKVVLQGEFAERGRTLRGRGLDIESQREALRDELLTLELEGKTPAEIARFREGRVAEIEAANPLDPFAPSAGVSGEDFATLLAAFERPPAVEGPRAASLAGQRILGAETTRRSEFADRSTAIDLRLGELESEAEAQKQLGLGGLLPRLGTEFKRLGVGAPTIFADVLEAVRRMGSDLPQSSVFPIDRNVLFPDDEEEERRRRERELEELLFSGVFAP